MNPGNPIYRIRTYDPERGDYTKDINCPEWVRGLPGLRRALRTLENLGYQARRPDAGILVELVPPMSEEHRRALDFVRIDTARNFRACEYRGMFLTA